MPVPKRKHSTQRRRTRWANKHIIASAFTKCNNCESTLMPHVVCQECGYFKGRKVIVTKAERALKRAAIAKQAQGATAENTQQA